MNALTRWQPFYSLTGTAAATLLGLVFVGTSLGATILPAGALGYPAVVLNTLVTPIVLRYTTVILLGAIMTIPSLSAYGVAAICLIASANGLADALTAGSRLRTDLALEQLPGDGTLWHATLPAVADLLLLASGAGVGLSHPRGLDGLAAATLMLLGVSIRNTWHLTAWVMNRHECSFAQQLPARRASFASGTDQAELPHELARERGPGVLQGTFE